MTSKCTKAPSGLLKREALCHHAISLIVNIPQYPADPVLIFVCMHGLETYGNEYLRVSRQHQRETLPVGADSCL